MERHLESQQTEWDARGAGARPSPDPHAGGAAGWPPGAARRVLVVLGKKPSRGSTLHPHFERNLVHALHLARRGVADVLVITGGPTRRGQRPEAVVGKERVTAHCPLPIVLETEARTTSENVRFVRDMMTAGPPERLVVVTSAYHVRRTRFLLGRHWPEMAGATTYESGRGTWSAAEWALNWVYLAGARLDPSERTFVRLTRRWLRNGAHRSPGPPRA